MDRSGSRSIRTITSVRLHGQEGRRGGARSRRFFRPGSFSGQSFTHGEGAPAAEEEISESLTLKFTGGHMSKIIGIDLGTSNTAASVMEGGKPTSSPRPRARPSAEGVPVLRGVRQGRAAARRRAGAAPGRRQPGRDVHGVQSARWARTTKFKAPDGKEYTPQQLSAFLLQEGEARRGSLPRRQDREGRHHRPGLLQRQPAPGHQGRGHHRGLEVVRIVNEPTAACLAYGIDKKGRTRRSWSSTSAAERSTSRSWTSAAASSR